MTQIEPAKFLTPCVVLALCACNESLSPHVSLNPNPSYEAFYPRERHEDEEHKDIKRESMSLRRIQEMFRMNSMLHK